MNDVNPHGLLPDATRLGPVELNVRDLLRMTSFYVAALGLQVQRQEPGMAALGAGREELLRLYQTPQVPTPQRHASLYHFCLAVEKRADLGWWLRRLLDDKFELQGLVDHRMAEAIYLNDPEGNGIELNWDRPRSEWRPWAEWLAMGNGPLDVEGLLADDQAAGPRPHLAAEARVGHIHLHVGDLATAELFFVGVLGLAKTAEVPGQAVFTSAGGYHHHFAFNVWAGRGVAPQPLGAWGLRSASLLLPTAADVEAVRARAKKAGLPIEERPDGVLLRDPSGHAILIRLDERH